MGNSAFKTLGGVTPLKKGEKGEGSGKTQVRKQHAGDVGTKARTNKAQDKSGYNTPGPDFINVHAFGPNTRTTMSLANTLSPSISAAVRGKGSYGDFSSTDEFEKTDDNGPDGEGYVKIERRKIGEGDTPNTGNEFADNCYEYTYEDGKPIRGAKKEGHIYTSKKTGKEILCKWGGRGGSGVHDYDKDERSEKNQSREVHYDKDDNVIKETPWTDD